MTTHEIVHDGKVIGEAMPCPVYKKRNGDWRIGFPVAGIGVTRPSFGIVFVFWDQEIRDNFYQTVTDELDAKGERWDHEQHT